MDLIPFYKNRGWMLAVALFVATGKLSAATTAPQRAAEDCSGRTQEAGKSQSKLSLGEAAPRGDRGMAIPLHLAAAPNETVGRIRAEVLVPQGPWDFKRVELPEDAGWKASAKERREKGAGSEGRQTWIELSIDAGSRAIPDGLIGHLSFALRGTGNQKLSGLTIRKLEVLPPETEIVEYPEPLAPPSELPIPNPQVGCFFFTH